MQSNHRTDLKLWRWQRTSALILLPLVLFHVIYLYVIVGMDGIATDTVSGRLQGAGFLVLDIALLLVVVVHAFTGIRSMAADYHGDRRKLGRVTKVIALLALVTIIYALVALSAFL